MGGLELIIFNDLASGPHVNPAVATATNMWHKDYVHITKESFQTLFESTDFHGFHSLYHLFC